MAKKSNVSKALPQDSGAITDSEHGKLISWINQADDSTRDSRLNSEKCRDYYDSKQWTEAEKQKLAKQKQAATVRNRIKPKIDGLLGMERSNRTTAKAFPRTPKHAQASTAVTESVRFVLQDNFYEQIRSSAWENLLIEGACGVEVIVKKKNNEPRITINHISWDRLIYDPHSRKKDFADAKFLGQFVWMDFDDAILLYPDGESVLQNMQTGSSTYEDVPRWMDNVRKRVKIVQLYWKSGKEIKYANFTLGGWLTEPKTTPYINEENDTVWPYEFARLFIDRDGGAYSAIFQLLDIQDEINKRGSKALHLMSVRQVKGERGAVEDVNKARAELAKPDGYIEVTPGMEFDILKTGDMAAAQFQLLAEAKQEIDAVSYNAAAAGKETRIMSGVALRNREAASQTELAPMFDVLKNLDIRVYRKVWNMIKQYWKEEMWIRVTDDEQNLKWVGLNKPVTRGEQALQQAQQEGANPQQLQALQQKIAQDPMSKEVVHTQNDIVNLDMDIVMSDAPDTLTTQIEDFQVLGEMVKSGFPMPPEAVILASPLSNKDQILKMMKEKPQIPPEMQKQMEDQQAQMQQMQKQTQQLQQENQQLKSGSQEAQMKLQADMKDSQMRQQMKQQEIQFNTQMEQQKAQNDTEFSIWKAKLDADTKITVAEIAAKNDASIAAKAAEQDLINKLGQGGLIDQSGNVPTNVPDILNASHQQLMQAHQQNFDSQQKQSKEISQVFTQMLKTLQDIQATLEKPKTVSLGKIQKDSSGKIIGATVNTLQ